MAPRKHARNTTTAAQPSPRSLDGAGDPAREGWERMSSGERRGRLSLVVGALVVAGSVSAIATGCGGSGHGAGGASATNGTREILPADMRQLEQRPGEA